MPSVILINTPLTREVVAENEQYLPPMGLGYIKTSLDEFHIETKLVDSLYEELSLSDITELILQTRPDFVGLNVFTPNMEIVKELITEIPASIEIILGAQIMKSVYREFADWNKKHKLHIVIGEGELIIPDIVLKAVKEKPIFETELCKVYNVTKNSVYFPNNLSLVRLNREIFKDRNMINHFGMEEACMISSRGCIYQCAFCGAANARNRDTMWRARDNQDIIEEINEIQAFTPNVSCIRMLDDLFLRDRKSIENAMNIFSKVNLKWRAMAHALSFKGNEQVFYEMKKNGCLELFIGIESGSDKIRKQIHKKGTVEYVYSIILDMLKSGIFVKGYFMYGFPDETEEDMLKTFQLAKRIHYSAKSLKGSFRNSTFQFRPYHGTELYCKIEREGNIKKDFLKDKNLESWVGRQQFNIISGNYSACSQEKIDYYINKTLQLNGE